MNMPTRSHGERLWSVDGFNEFLIGVKWFGWSS
jgi:hypothetical protein